MASWKTPEHLWTREYMENQLVVILFYSYF